MVISNDCSGLIKISEANTDIIFLYSSIHSYPVAEFLSKDIEYAREKNKKNGVELRTVRFPRSARL